MTDDNGQFPVRRLGELLTLEYGETLPEDGRHGGDVPVYGSNGIVGHHSNSRVEGPGIVVGRKGSIGRVAWVGKDFWPIDTTYYVKPKTGHSLRWLYYLLDTRDMGRLNSATGVPGLNREDVYALKVPIPSEPEAAAISNILTSVDKAIEKTRDVIDQTRNLKTALFQDLLAHGLPGKHAEFVKHKNLGTIPMAWDVVKLDSLIEPARPVCYGILMPGTGHPGGIPVIKVKDIIGGLVKSDGLLLTTPELDEEYRRSRLKGGDLLLSIRGSTGRVGIVPDKLTGANITQDTARLACLDNIIRDWLYYILQGHELQSYVQQHTIGQAVKGINIADVRRIPVPLPDEHERKQIVDLFHAVEARINTESNQLKRLIRSKTALSQALLMGRVRITQRSEITDANT